MRTQSEKLRKLEERQRRLRAQIERTRAAETVRERKRDTRRKIVVGAMVLGMVERGEWTKEQLVEKLDGYLTRAQDRELFDLPVREAEGERAEEGGEASQTARTHGAGVSSRLA